MVVFCMPGCVSVCCTGAMEGVEPLLVVAVVDYAECVLSGACLHGLVIKKPRAQGSTEPSFEGPAASSCSQEPARPLLVWNSGHLFSSRGVLGWLHCCSVSNVFGTS